MPWGGYSSNGFNFTLCFSKVQKTLWGWESLTLLILEQGGHQGVGLGAGKKNTGLPDSRTRGPAAPAFLVFI